MNQQQLASASMAALLAAGASLPAAAQAHAHMQAGTGPVATHTRQSVQFPSQLREHELANMRDHLATLAKIQLALSKNDIDEAASLAEKRLGMSSFELHGAHEVAKYMPKGTQDIGIYRYTSAGRLAPSANAFACAVLA